MWLVGAEEEGAPWPEAEVVEEEGRKAASVPGELTSQAQHHCVQLPDRAVGFGGTEPVHQGGGRVADRVARTDCERAEQLG